VEEAEKYKAEDDAANAHNTSKNSFESYIYNLQQSLSNLKGAVNRAIEWYDISQEASKEEYEQKQTEIEAIVNPILQRLYSAAA